MIERLKGYLNKKDLGLFVLIVFYLVGLLGFRSADRPELISYTPFNLLLTAAILFLNHKGENGKLLFYTTLCFTLSMLIEIAGVRTGHIFGSYVYGETLGYKIFDVPLMIGLNWTILVYSIVILLRNNIKNKIVFALIGSFVLVAFDFLMEPAAIELDFWSWQDGDVPLRNYLGWFTTSFILLLLAPARANRWINPLAFWVLIVQIIFFVFLMT